MGLGHTTCHMRHEACGISKCVDWHAKLILLRLNALAFPIAVACVRKTHWKMILLFLVQHFPLQLQLLLILFLLPLLVLLPVAVAGIDASCDSCAIINYMPHFRSSQSAQLKLLHLPRQAHHIRSSLADDVATCNVLTVLASRSADFTCYVAGLLPKELPKFC